MKVKEIMSRSVEAVRPEATLQEAATKMKSHDVGMLPVDDGTKVVGVITDRDIVLRGVAKGSDPKSTAVRDAMTEDVVSCRETDSVKDVARTMKDRQIRRVVVIDANKRMAGIVSLGDVAVGSTDDELKGEVLEQVSEPTRRR
jgi:CBS domain-containing protein